jgi:hypothetical protein
LQAKGKFERRPKSGFCRYFFPSLPCHLRANCELIMGQLRAN